MRQQIDVLQTDFADSLTAAKADQESSGHEIPTSVVSLLLTFILESRAAGDGRVLKFSRSI